MVTLPKMKSLSKPSLDLRGASKIFKQKKAGGDYFWNYLRQDCTKNLAHSTVGLCMKPVNEKENLACRRQRTL